MIPDSAAHRNLTLFSCSCIIQHQYPRNYHRNWKQIKSETPLVSSKFSLFLVILPPLMTCLQSLNFCNQWIIYRNKIQTHKNSYNYRSFFIFYYLLNSKLVRSFLFLSSNRINVSKNEKNKKNCEFSLFGSVFRINRFKILWESLYFHILFQLGTYKFP